MEELPRSKAIGKEIEGTWRGAIEPKGGRQIRLVLTMANRSDGTATGKFVNVDEGGLVIPVTIAQEGSRLTLAAPTVGGSYECALNKEGTELSGTFTQGQFTAPLVLRRAQ